MDEIRLSDLSKNTSPDPDSFTIATPQSDESCTDSFLAHSKPTFKVSWRSIFAFTNKRHFLVLAVALLLSIISGLVIPGMSILLGKVFGAFAGFGSGALSPEMFMHEVTKAIVYLTLLACASWLLNGAFFACWLWFGELQAKAAREKLFESLIVRDVEWFEERTNGVSAMLSKSQTQINELQSAVSQPLGYATQSMVTAVASLAVALYHSWSLTLVILAAVPLALGLLGTLSSRTQPHISKQKLHLERASQTASCAINSIDTVKAFNGQPREQSTFSNAIDFAAGEQKALARLHALQMGFIRLFTFIMFVQGFWYGTKLVRGSHHSPPAAIMTTFWSCLMATQALELIIPQMVFLEKGRCAGTSLKALVANVEERAGCYHRLGGYTPLTCSGEIEVSGVSFAYPSRPSELAIVDLNLRFPANKTTFIVGRSGSGKSTLGRLLLNTYRPLFGDISIAGHSIKALDPRWIRENVSLIQQQSTLFNETVFRNISFGQEDYENVTQAQVMDVCRMAALERTIMDLPRGLNTIVGGKQLSGGELQRVAIARDRLRDATILILDEALGALDTFSRRIVAEAIRKWRHGKTTIIITHDISELGPDDFAYVMDCGRVVQQGYRRDLESRTGTFRSFVLASDPAKRRWSQRMSQYASLIPALDTKFWNEDPTHLELSPTGVGFPTSDSDDSSSSLNHTDEGRRMLPPENTMVRDGRFSEVTSSATTPSSSTFQSFPSTSENSVKAKLLPKPTRVSTTVVKTSLIHIFSTIWPSFTLRQKLLLLSGFLAAILHALATPTFSFALARLLQSILDTRLSETEARKWSLSIIGIALIDGLCCYTMHFLFETCAQCWVDQHRKNSLVRVLDQPRAWFHDDKNSVETLVEDMEKHAEEMRNLLSRFAGYGLVGFMLTIIGITWSLACSWRLTLVGLCVGPVMYGLSRGMEWTSSRYESMCNDSAQVIGSILYEAITNIRTVRNYRVERYFSKKYYSATKSALSIGIRRSIYTGLWFGLADSSILFATALVFYYGALLISKSQEDFQDVLSVFTLLLFSLSYANAIVGMIPQVSNSKDSALRLLRLSSLPRNSHEHDGTLPFPAATGTITFKNVVFAYPSRPQLSVLRDLDLTISAGECLAIVGASGSGKSTLSALLQRLYNPTYGEIMIASTPLTSLSTHLLREQLAVLSQNPTLFDATIAENITYGLSPSPDIADVIRAAKMAGAHDFITSLPESYNTLLGDAGVGLSDGQAQRVAIARALVRRPRILILDECTSNLDAESARTVKECLLRLVEEERGRMTVIMITHSKELMKAAQRIVVIADGTVIEDGRYGELMAKGGAFSKLLEGHLG